MKLYLTVFVTLFIFLSCATVEEVSIDDQEPSEEKTEVAEYAAPDWYSYTNRSYSDSLSFTGVGMAASVDEANGREKATNQAVANLKLSLDTFAENVRIEQAEKSSSSEFNSSEFITNLRNAVQNIAIGDQVETLEEHIETEESVHQIYIKVILSKDSALNALQNELDHAGFVRALNL